MKVIGNKSTRYYQYRIGMTLYVDKKQMLKVQHRAQKRASNMLNMSD